MGFSKLLRLAAVSATLITQGTLTAQTPGLSQTVAWNNAAVTFIAQTLDVTDTASAAGSLLARWRVGGVDKFVVSKAGAITAAGGVTAGAASFTTLSASSTSELMGSVGIGGAATAKLDVWSGIRSGGQAGGFRLGADADALTRTDATRKLGMMFAPHYTNAASGVFWTALDSTGTDNIIYVGGGYSGYNAATVISFQTGATTTTDTGTEIGRFNATQFIVGASTFVVTAATGAVNASGAINAGGGAGGSATLQATGARNNWLGAALMLNSTSTGLQQWGMYIGAANELYIGDRTGSVNPITITPATQAVLMGGALAITGALTGVTTLNMSGALTTNGGVQTFGANDSGGAGYRLVLVPNV